MQFYCAYWSEQKSLLFEDAMYSTEIQCTAVARERFLDRGGRKYKI